MTGDSLEHNTTASAPHINPAEALASGHPPVSPADETSRPDVPVHTDADSSASATADNLANDSIARIDSLPATATSTLSKHAPQRPTPPAWHSGIQPLPRPQVAADHPGIISMFIILFIILSITFKHSRKLFGSLWRDLWSVRRRRRQYTKRTPAESRMVAVFYIQLIIFLALLTQCHFRLLWAQGSDISWSFPRTIVYSLMWLAYYLFSLSAYRTVGYTFGQPITTSLWLRGFNAAQVFAGFGLAIPAAIAVFYPDLAGSAVLWGAAIWLLAHIIFIFKGFRIFYSGLPSILDFFLYLCALEITPLALLYSVAQYIARSPMLAS